MMCTHSDLTHLLTRLGQQSLPARVETMINAALESSGYYNHPRKGDNWDSQMVEIKVHNLSAQGDSNEEAIRNWMCVATNTVNATEASTLLHSPDHIPVQDMKDACQTILDHRGPTPHPDHRMAEQLLLVLEQHA